MIRRWHRRPTHARSDRHRCVARTRRGAGRGTARARLARRRRRPHRERPACRRALPLRRLRPRAAGAHRPPRHAARCAIIAAAQAGSGDARQQCRRRDAGRLRRPPSTASAAAALAINVAAPLALADALPARVPDDRLRAPDHQRFLGRRADRDRRAALVYGMSKAALEMLTRTIAAECSAPRFRCISLRPGHLRHRHAGVHAQPRPGGISERRAVPRLQGQRARSRRPPKSRRRSSTGSCSRERRARPTLHAPGPVTPARRRATAPSRRRLRVGAGVQLAIR